MRACRGTDSGRPAGSRRWHERGGRVPAGRHQRVDGLRVEDKYAGLGLSELRELRQLREENAKLKRLVADPSLDRHMLQEIVRKRLYGLGTGAC